MKVRLQIATAPGGSTTLEHAGPVVRIGRDPECELALQGEASQSVSRQHARIDLAAGGATVCDNGSSNGTLLNDRPVTTPAPPRVGDRSQLGYTGPTLTVVELDLAAGGEPGGRLLSPRVLGIGAGVGVAVVGIVLAVVYFSRPSEEPSGSPEA